jgi:hypothetical protein
VAAHTLQAAGVSEFELPLYRHERGPRSSLMHVSSRKAQDHGLTLTDPAQTLRDVRAWLGSDTFPLSLSPEREAELIRAARGGGAAER